ncbi:hypothetical protein LEP1GSC125_3869 [Leptospira mayottensis 200901122]|uniref:Uncharacterized protein n=1 Tax=Leptospira mayottensis 200901122 TaxID=1193010 RepID=A0AA87SVD9_9LEPT|nr:hypothetical protein LEP1GSC125_3869 [Leptospira mayottensis 200901122]
MRGAEFHLTQTLRHTDKLRETYRKTLTNHNKATPQLSNTRSAASFT